MEILMCSIFVCPIFVVGIVFDLIYKALATPGRE